MKKGRHLLSETLQTAPTLTDQFSYPFLSN